MTSLGYYTSEKIWYPNPKEIAIAFVRRARGSNLSFDLVFTRVLFGDKKREMKIDSRVGGKRLWFWSAEIIPFNIFFPFTFFRHFFSHKNKHNRDLCGIIYVRQ